MAKKVNWRDAGAKNQASPLGAFHSRDAGCSSIHHPRTSSASNDATGCPSRFSLYRLFVSVGSQITEAGILMVSGLVRSLMQYTRSVGVSTVGAMTPSDELNEAS